MTPGTHLLIGWSCANVTALSRRDRALITLAGITPVELISKKWDEAVVATFAKLYFSVFGHKDPNVSAGRNQT